MSGPSYQAVAAAQRAAGNDVCGVRALDAAHDPVLGIDVSVCLRDVVEWHEAWVPEPARDLWRAAFMAKFGGAS